MGHVLQGACHGSGERLVELVGENGCACSGVRDWRLTRSSHVSFQIEASLPTFPHAA